MNNLKLGIMPVVMVIVTTIVSAIGMQIMAAYGMQSIFYYVVASLLFFIPTSVAVMILVNAENGSGLYGWVKTTLGTSLAFTAVWLQWSSTIVFYPTVLAFLASIIGYVIDPHLIDNPYYMFACMLVFGWLSVFANLSGMRFSVKLSNIGAIFAAIVPAVLIALLGLIWFLQTPTTSVHWQTITWIPQHVDLSTLALLASFVVAFAGIEYSSCFVKHMQHPQKNYRYAVGIATIAVIILNILGTLGIACLVSPQKLNLMTGFMQAFSTFFNAYHQAWLSWVIGLMMVLGFLCAVSTLMLSVALGLLVLTQNQLLPAKWGVLNRNGAPAKIILAQGIFMTILSLLYLFLPQVKHAYWITGVVASVLVGLKYIIMFIAAMKACLSRRWLVYPICTIGLAACVLVIILAFIPPTQLDVINTYYFEFTMITMTLSVLLLPLIVTYKYIRNARSSLVQNEFVAQQSKVVEF